MPWTWQGTYRASYHGHVSMPKGDYLGMPTCMPHRLFPLPAKLARAFFQIMFLNLFYNFSGGFPTIGWAFRQFF